jgi:hypothetical protein
MAAGRDLERIATGAVAVLPDPLPRYLAHLQVTRRVALRTLALYTEA